MDAFAVFGFVGFLMVLFLWSKVTRLERILRENGIRPAAAKDLGRKLGQWVGREVTLSLYGADGETQGQPCRVLDADSGEALGILSEVSATGANDVWHVQREGKEYLVPAIPDVVVSVDVDGEEIRLRPLKGIFDDAD